MNFQNWQDQRCNIVQFYHPFPGDRFHLVIAQLLKLLKAVCPPMQCNALRWWYDLNFSHINIKSDLQTHNPFVGPMKQNRSKWVLLIIQIIFLLLYKYQECPSNTQPFCWSYRAKQIRTSTLLQNIFRAPDFIFLVSLSALSSHLLSCK